MYLTPVQKNLTQLDIDRICEELIDERTPHNCPDCNAAPGELHLDYCDVARRSVCGGQLLSCNCENGTPDVWTGLWPGIRECYELKLICYDTNELMWRFDLNAYCRNTH